MNCTQLKMGRETQACRLLKNLNLYPKLEKKNLSWSAKPRTAGCYRVNPNPQQPRTLRLILKRKQKKENHKKKNFCFAFAEGGECSLCILFLNFLQSGNFICSIFTSAYSTTHIDFLS
jgi:hypothetical protein